MNLLREIADLPAKDCPGCATAPRTAVGNYLSHGCPEPHHRRWEHFTRLRGALMKEYLILAVAALRAGSLPGGSP